MGDYPPRLVNWRNIPIALIDLHTGGFERKRLLTSTTTFFGIPCRLPGEKAITQYGSFCISFPVSQSQAPMAMKSDYNCAEVAQCRYPTTTAYVTSTLKKVMTSFCCLPRRMRA